MQIRKRNREYPQNQLKGLINTSNIGSSLFVLFSTGDFIRLQRPHIIPDSGWGWALCLRTLLMVGRCFIAFCGFIMVSPRALMLRTRILALTGRRGIGVRRATDQGTDRRTDRGANGRDHWVHRR
ncbi:hypothetical protein BDV25DRAFT_164793 [Aspergillus avenaceus]|uniref:Uncharacterized protein n=1 Tax=Aspergillus avenaceus TaxID=36643 RepID=A0A5N6TGD5_ASPAV|nr:hypothetical protein BDV25DRAFT_164793 [Aspergillus avenaceus]